MRFVDEREARLTLGISLAEAKAGGGQLDLFGGPAPGEDPLLATLRERGGASWVRTISALNEAIARLRSRGVTAAHLERVRGGVAQSRAKTLASAMRGLDDALARSGRRDERLLGTLLASALRDVGREAVRSVVGAAIVRARWILTWEPDDLAWWRALDDLIGDARVILPAVDKPLEGARDRDPFEVIADNVARHLDAAPETEAIAPILGDFLNEPPKDPSRVRLLRADTVRAQAHVAAELARSALLDATPVERIAIAYVVRNEDSLRPLRQALLTAGLIYHDRLEPPPVSAPVVAAALHALEAAQSRDRRAVAKLLRSGYINPHQLASDHEDADAVLHKLARALETRATAAGKDEGERLIRTVGDVYPDVLARLVEILDRARTGRTRGERVTQTRTLLFDLGFASRLEEGGLTTFQRDQHGGVDAIERRAVVGDLRAWERFQDTLDAYEEAGASEHLVDPEVFQMELAELLAAANRAPQAGRAGAIRLVRLNDLVGEELDLVIVIDANDGALPRDVAPITLISEGLDSAMTRLLRDGGAFGELAARDLAALGCVAAESSRMVFITTSEQSADAPSTPSRVVVSLERAGLTIESTEVAIREVAQSSEEVRRRSLIEFERESFFLDPMRQTSEIVGVLNATPRLSQTLTDETGGTPRRAMAVTALERFAQCPFKGYAQVILGARESEEQKELPDAREEGNLGHSALCAAFTATRVEWAIRPRDPAAIMARGLTAADTALDAVSGHAPLRAIVRLRIRESVRALLERALSEESWDFALAEQAFGSSSIASSWPAFDLAGVLWLRGSIDRLDQAHGRNLVRVVDYKRSRSTVRSSTAALGETALQVPIYAAVAARRLKASATGTYLPMQPRDLALEPAGRVNAETRVSALVDRASKNASEIEVRAIDIVRSARSGRVAPLPAKESECSYCDVSGACRKPRFAMAPNDEAEAQEGQ